MKIRQIRFRNINSFYGEHDPIKFTDGLLASTGLFIIAGPTGAGKSTLLDVITLALFNRIPRLSGAISLTNITEEGLVVNQHAAQEPGTAAYAEIEYEINRQVYRSRWSIKKNRNNNWNNYEMEVAHLPEGQSEGVLFPLKNLLEFPKKNEELIGLTYEQFVRSIVLAQGAFDQFLKAKAAERSKMLEKITGTEIYRQLSLRAYAVTKEFETRIFQKSQESSLIQVLSDDAVLELKQQQKALNDSLKLVADRIKLLTDEQLLCQRIAEVENVLQNLDRQRIDLQKQQLAFTPQADRLKKHDLVADLASMFIELSGYERDKQQAIKHQQLVLADKVKLETALTDLVAQAKILTKQPDLTLDTFETSISDFQESILALTNQIALERDRLTQPLRAIQQTIQSVRDEWFQNLNLKNIDQTINALANRQLDTIARINELQANYPAITIDSMAVEMERLVTVEKQLAPLLELISAQNQRMLDGMELTKQIQALEEEVNTTEPVLKNQQEEIALSEIEVKKLEKQNIQFATEARLDKLREALEADQPCPLCGSLDHPYARHYLQESVNLAETLQKATFIWNEKRMLTEELARAVLEKKTTRKGLEEQRVQLRDVFKQKKVEIIAKLSALSLPDDINVNELANQQQLAQQQRLELNELLSLWEKQRLITRLLEDLAIIQASTNQLQLLKQQKDKLYPGDDIKSRSEQVSGRFNQLTSQLSLQAKLLADAATDLTSAEGRFERHWRLLDSILQERSITDVAEARTYLLDTITLRKLQSQQQELLDKARDIDQQRIAENLKREDAQNARRLPGTLSDLEQELAEKKQLERTQIEQIGYFKKQLETDQQERKRHKKLIDSLTRLETEARPWRELNRLIGSAKGDEYSKFAQGLTLAQLIGLSNRRLRDLSDRYLLLKPRDGQDELYVVDQYQGSAERSVASLSGGETFTLSLALALGLSDLASQNVQIDSLFIDEGFGTLDPETLDTAIVMLEKLQHDSQKTIGIISHRQEIKERISVQIQVEKGTDGNSRIRITDTL